MNLISLWLSSLAWGLGLGAAFTAALILLNVANLGHLVNTAETPLLWLIMLWIPFSTLIGGVHFALHIFDDTDQSSPP